MMSISMALTVIFLNDDDSFTSISGDVDMLWLYLVYFKADCKVLCWFRITVIDNSYPETPVRPCSTTPQHNCCINYLLKVILSSCI